MWFTGNLWFRTASLVMSLFFLSTTVLYAGDAELLKSIAVDTGCESSQVTLSTDTIPQCTDQYTHTVIGDAAMVAGYKLPVALELSELSQLGVLEQCGETQASAIIAGDDDAATMALLVGLILGTALLIWMYKSTEVDDE